MDLGLKDKIVLVTAASKGIGRAVAELAVAAGATVIAASRSGKAPAGAHPLTVDLCGEEASALVPQVIERFGAIDGLVFNSPGPKLGPAVANGMAVWDDAYGQLLRPALSVGLAAANAMRGRGGSIVFLTSTWVKQPAPNGGLSAVMRAGVAALSKQLATELAAEGVRVNQVMPGATATDRMTAVLEGKAQANGTTIEAEAAKAAADIPMRRWGEPIEIANAVLFLLSPASAFTTGATLQVDGGSTRGTL
ncbi:MAG TPA: SDR family oxidoreductase [Phenylobacterium sp.]|nr:SDR family oxidoreductase [Phenylobacterium sp.]